MDLLQGCSVQAMTKAGCRFSGMATAYHPWTQSVLVGFFQEDNDHIPSNKIACTVPLSTYWSDATSSETLVCQPEQLYSLEHSLIPMPHDKKSFYSSDEGFGYLKKEDRLIACKVYIIAC